MRKLLLSSVALLFLCSTASAQITQEVIDNANAASMGAGMTKEEARDNGINARIQIELAEELYYDWLASGEDPIQFVEDSIAAAKVEAALGDDDYGAKLERNGGGQVVMYDATLTNVVQEPYPPGARPKVILIPGTGYEKWSQGNAHLRRANLAGLLAGTVKLTNAQPFFLDSLDHYIDAFNHAELAFQEVENYMYYGGMY